MKKSKLGEYNKSFFNKNLSPNFGQLKISALGVCRWFRFAQLAKGKKSRP